MKPEYDSKSTDDPELAKELTLQVRKVIGPFAAPKKIVRESISMILTPHCFHPLSSHYPFFREMMLMLPSTSCPTFQRLGVERS
jgi:hypothetical protein